jgi:hypothetical protein
MRRTGTAAKRKTTSSREQPVTAGKRPKRGVAKIKDTRGSLWEKMENMFNSAESVDDPSEEEEEEDMEDYDEDTEDDDEFELEDDEVVGSVDVEVKCGVCGQSFRSVTR